MRDDKLGHIDDTLFMFVEQWTFAVTHSILQIES